MRLWSALQVAYFAWRIPLARSSVGFSPWGHKEEHNTRSNLAEHTHEALELRSSALSVSSSLWNCTWLLVTSVLDVGQVSSEAGWNIIQLGQKVPILSPPFIPLLPTAFWHHGVTSRDVEVLLSWRVFEAPLPSPA